METERNSPRQWTWREVGIFASTQEGLVTRSQLRELGLGDGAVSKAVSRGWLHPVFPAVYLVGHRHLARQGKLLAATLACGSGSVVSHGTAALLLELSDRQFERIDVIAPIEAGRKITGIRRRFVPPPAGHEVWRRHRVPLTSPSRTIVDCASSEPRRLAGLIEQAAVLGLLDVQAIDRVLDGPRRRGSRHLLRILEPWRRYRPGIKIRSRMEAKLLPLLSEAGLPIPQTNARITVNGRRYEVDFLWRDQKVVVEADGGRFHDNPAAGVRDSERNQALSDAGYRIPRLGWEDLRDRPGAAMSEIKHLLQRRTRSAVPFGPGRAKRNSGG